MKIKLILLTLLTCLTLNSFSKINRFTFRNDSVYLDSTTNIGYLSTNTLGTEYVYHVPYLVLNFKTKKYLYPIIGQYVLNQYMKYNKSITNIKYKYRHTDKSITIYLTKKEIIYMVSKNLKESKDIKILALGGGIILSQFLLSGLVRYVEKH